MHSGINGVNGASQKAQHTDPIPHQYASPVTTANIYGTHTSHDTTAVTITKIIKLRQSFNWSHSHLKNLLILVISSLFWVTS